MKRLLQYYLAQLTISASLRGAFLIGALLTLIVSAVSLGSWYEQSRQVRHALDDYFPGIQASFQIESHLSTLVNGLNEFLLAANTSARLQLRDQIMAHFTQIEQASRRLDSQQQQQIQHTLVQSRQLLANLDAALYAMFISREKLNEVASRIDWLHDDFISELNSLSQDISWQQGALLDQLDQDHSTSGRQRLQLRLRSVQSEQQLVYTLARIENQITDDLRDRLSEIQAGGNGVENLEGHIRYLRYLQETAQDNMQALQAHPSTVTLRQTIEELLDIGMAESKMPAALRDYARSQTALTRAASAKDQTLARFRAQLESQLGSSHLQMRTFNQRLEQIMWISGSLILVATFLALLLAYLLNHSFIRSRLVKRFTALNQAVAHIGLGKLDTLIPVYGRDELGRIARLLRHTLSQLHQQQQWLEAEIAERREIEHHLRTTQDELVQAAKLAVVGQTMTTLAHEINQPLNALSLYLYIARTALAGGQSEHAVSQLEKASGLIGRIDAIIRSLRQFSRRADQHAALRALPLRPAILAAWELLASRHKPQRGQLLLPDDGPQILADEVRLQQVLVNILSNALDACPDAPCIRIHWQQQGAQWQVLIEDNGGGWPLALAPSLLKPFTTSKSVGLGIGLSISVSLMEQQRGSLRLASTLSRNACVILQFCCPLPPELA